MIKFQTVSFFNLSSFVLYFLNILWPECLSSEKLNKTGSLITFTRLPFIKSPLTWNKSFSLILTGFSLVNLSILYSASINTCNVLKNDVPSNINTSFLVVCKVIKLLFVIPYFFCSEFKVLLKFLKSYFRGGMQENLCSLSKFFCPDVFYFIIR